MGMNKAQREAKKREAAAKVAAILEQPAEQPKQEAAATPAPAQAAPVPANKVTATFDRLKAGWLAKGINLDEMKVTPDGKFTLVVVAPGWPTVQIGPTGGITVKELKSYADAFTASMEGLERYTKQLAREAKHAQATAPASQTVAVA